MEKKVIKTEEELNEVITALEQSIRKKLEWYKKFCTIRTEHYIEWNSVIYYASSGFITPAELNSLVNAVAPFMEYEHFFWQLEPNYIKGVPVVAFTANIKK